MTLWEKAEALRLLHEQPELLVLPNVAEAVLAGEAPPQPRALRPPMSRNVAPSDGS